MGQHKSKAESKNLKSQEKVTPIQINKNVEMMLSNCQDVNNVVQFDRDQKATPIWISTYTSDIELTKYLISLGADVNVVCGNLEMTPLHIACHNKHTELVKLLLESGADANVIDHWNFTPSIYAVLCNDPFIVITILNLLIKYGGDMNFGAVLNADSDVRCGFNLNIGEFGCQYDTSLGVNTFITQPQGPISGNALHHSAQNPYIPNEILALISEAGCNVNSQNLHGQTPLMCAVMDIYYDYHQNIQQHIELLLEKGALLNIQDNRGWTALHYACQRGGLSAMKSLLAAGADCSIQGALNETPLWILLIYGWKTAAEYLIKDGCDMNSTILSTDIVRFNSDMDLPRYGEIYPLEFVICNRYFDTAELLITAGCKLPLDVQLEYQGIDEASITQVNKLRELYDYIHDPYRLWTLKELGCQATRNAYKKAITTKLETVGVPQSVRNYVLLS